MLNNLLRFKQKDRQNCFVDSSTPTSSTPPPCNFNFVAHAIGAGVRYHTPIGPVRVDIGYNLNPALFPVRQASTTSPAHSETIKHFNFFFSIGQTF